VNPAADLPSWRRRSRRSPARPQRRDISKRIDAIQNATHRSVEAIAGISYTIRELIGFSVRIASTVEQQPKGAQEIASNLASVSANVVNLNGAITKAETVGNRTAQAAAMLSTASVSVTKQAKRIHEQATAFTKTSCALVTVRSPTHRS
jgi:methyl-accepting chemotaxis protein